MAARAGLANLILELRGMTETGVNDYSVNSVAYWTDDQLQLKLDSMSVRTDINNVPLTPVIENTPGGTAQYLTYYAPKGYLEEATGGTAVWRVVDSLGSVVGTANYSVEYVPGIIRFNTNTAGTSYYLWARSYNLDAAAALVWRTKAAHVASAYNFASDNQKFDRAVLRTSYLAMAKEFDEKGGVSTGIRSVQMVRTDLLPKQGGGWS